MGVRNYKILFNGLDVGKLNIKPFDFPYETADSRIAVDVNITHVEFFAYGTVYFFLQTLILLICADTDVNFRLGKADIDHHLAAYLLDSVRKPKSLYPFSMYIVGRPLNYFDRGEVREESHRFWENWRKKLNATS